MNKVRTTVETSQRGIELLGRKRDYLLVALILLKLTGHIDISWWWVTSPLWGALLFMGLVDWMDIKIKRTIITTTTTEEL